MPEQQPNVELPSQVKRVTLLGKAKDLAYDMSKFFRERGLTGDKKPSVLTSPKDNETKKPEEQGT